MKPTANAGAEPPFSPAAESPPPEMAETIEAGADAQALATDHNPDATSLLRRYLSEVHSFREIGNQALRDLESRLAMLPRQGAQPAIEEPVLAAQPASHPAAAEEKGRDPEPSLTQRLNELSAYLHADLTREKAGGDATPAQAAPPRIQVRAAQPRPQPQPKQPPRAAVEPRAVQQPQHKIPTAPVLDRAWFEQRFAALRASIDRLTEEVPLKRIEALEAQFNNLMQRLAAREQARDLRPMEASLRELAAYLADTREWHTAQDQRMRTMEGRLDRLSHLVAQSHAAISQTAKGLEIVAKGTGEKLARATASIIITSLGDKIDSLDPAARLDELGLKVAQLTQNNPSQRLEQLGREVAHLSAQSRIISRNTEDRLGQIEIALKERPRAAAPAAPPPVVGRRPQAKAAPSDLSSRDELESYLNHQPDPSDDDYDSEMIAAAQRAAALADVPSRSASSRASAAPYQIPYGDFLTDDDSPASRAGLIIAVVILLLAGAVMLFLKAKEWTLNEPGPAARLEHGRTEPTIVKTERIERKGAALAPQAGDAGGQRLGGVVVVTGSTPAAPPLASKPLQLWLAAKETDAAAAAARPGGQVENQPESSFRQAAIQGDAKAQFSAGQSYLQADGGDTTLAEGDGLSVAARWFRRAAEGGHAPAQFKLARLYELGRGAPRDSAEAEKWYGRAASQGHVQAMHSLAMLAGSPNRRSANYLTAAKWFAEAAAYGLLESQFNLGILYEHGLGLPRSAADAYFWFALAARQHDAKAMQKRDELGWRLSRAERLSEDRRVASWKARPQSEEINRAAPEPPVASREPQKPALPDPEPVASVAVMRASWKPDVATAIKTSGKPALIAEAQRLLKQRGYDPGPIDGMPGPRTEAAVRNFQRSAGLDVTGQISEPLIVKMAFLPL